MNIFRIGPYLTPDVQRATPRATPAPARSAHAAGARGVEIPTDGPPGTDHRLWSVLTAEERSYFARAAGTLSYGPAGRATSTVRGQVLNIRI